VLRRVLGLYADKGWRPVIAPELEFYLVAVNTDPDYPLEPPEGRSGRQESGRQAYGIDAVNEFDHVMDDLYDF
jgi:glutamine synthetase